MSRPVVSIVTPSYNNVAYLEEALASVAAQDYPAIEHIVIDGGSDDGSVDVIRSHEQRLAFWSSEPDRGQAHALNKGFARSTGSLLGWLNSDDALVPGAISAVVEAFEREPETVLVYGSNTMVDDRGASLGLLPSRPFDVVEMVRTAQNHVPQPGSLFSRRGYELAGPFNEQGYYYFDFEFVIRLGIAGSAIELDRVLGLYRLHPESKTESAPRLKAEDHLRLYDEIFSQPNLPAELRDVEATGRSRAELVAGEYFYASLDRRRARTELLRGLRRQPAHADLRTASLVAKTFLPSRVVRGLRARRSRA